MLKRNNNPELVKTKYGFYTVKNKPSMAELNDFYANSYFQDDSSTRVYKSNYSEEEYNHKVFISKLIATKAMQLFKNAKNAYDIGCGEGFLLEEFYKLNLKVKSCDFSNAIKRFFSHLEEFHSQGNIYEIISDVFEKEKFDIITVQNVLEHVVEPVELLKLLRKGMHKDSILAISVPNDFSDLQMKLLEKKKIRERWLCYPDHLSYFTPESMENFTNDLGLKIASKTITFPIEMFLLNDVLNYDKDPSKGKGAYSIVRDFDLYLSTLDINKVIELYDKFAQLGVGRNYTYYCKLK